MLEKHTVTKAEIGMIRIYMHRAEKSGKTSLKRLWSSPPLYRELVAQAKADGLLNATAQPTQYGYSNGGTIRQHGSEIPDPQLTMYVELIGARHALEAFCRRRGSVLTGKLVVYKPLEHWSVTPTHLMHANA